MLGKDELEVVHFLQVVPLSNLTENRGARSRKVLMDMILQF